MKIRMHRGSLERSMETEKTIEPTLDAVHQYYEEGYGIKIPKEAITIKKYGGGIDERIGWDTYAVKAEGFGFLGFTDGPLKVPEDNKQEK